GAQGCQHAEKSLGLRTDRFGVCPSRRLVWGDTHQLGKLCAGKFELVSKEAYFRWNQARGLFSNRERERPMELADCRNLHEGLAIFWADKLRYVVKDDMVHAALAVDMLSNRL